MRNLNKQERAGIEAVAKRFSATLEKHDGPADSYLKVAGKRLAVDVTRLKPRGTSQGRAAKPRLRFDKVVIRLMEHLQDSLRKTVPDGVTVLLTVTAPIRLPSKTALALEAKIQALLERGSPVRDEKDTIHGNRIQIRFLRDQSERAPKMIGFVHNADSDALLLLNMTHELFERIGAAAGSRTTKRAPKHRDERWLVAICAEAIPHLETYRYIYSQLRTPADFKKILLVSGDGHVGVLTGYADSKSRNR